MHPLAVASRDALGLGPTLLIAAAVLIVGGFVLTRWTVITKALSKQSAPPPTEQAQRVVRLTGFVALGVGVVLLIVGVVLL